MMKHKENCIKNCEVKQKILIKYHYHYNSNGILLRLSEYAIWPCLAHPITNKRNVISDTCLIIKLIFGLIFEHTVLLSST
jgi:hypothetical protein